MRALAALLLLFLPGLASAAELIEPPFLKPLVEEGKLPPVARRVPSQPSIVKMDEPWQAPGRYGGEIRMLMSQPRDTRMMVVYGYARLVGYDPSWRLVPDILEKLDVIDGRIFTLTLRKGHRWSDGHPFTSEDFRFFWEDDVNNAELSPGGPEAFLRVDGKPPVFEVIDETTVRYTWEKPNPFFLPALAGARPEYIFEPAHYLKQFHPRYAEPAALKQKVGEAGQRNWATLYNLRGRQYRNDNPDLPTLEPWVLQTRPPSSYFVFTRNPYFHRIDARGLQLPYVDKVSLTMVSAGLIPAKAAAGDADLQARGLTFDNIAVLKQGEKSKLFRVHLWKSARGSDLAIYPNLNTTDPDLAPLVRNADFRRALSLAINRDEINQVVFVGFGRPGNDTVLPDSPLFEPEYETRWAKFDLTRANKLLDGVGLDKRDASGIRLRNDGKRLELVVETAGESPTEVAILQLIADSWKKAGIALLIKPEQREILRNRVFSGEAALSVWFGLENGLPNAHSLPLELAPTSQQQLCWPKWGQHYETGGRIGEPPDLEPVQELAKLNEAWLTTIDDGAKRTIWKQMLEIRADQAFSIGTVRLVPQPVVVSARLRNVPTSGVYNWEPGAHFGVYHPDTFWYEDGAAKP